MSWSWTPAGLPRRLTGGQVWAGTLMAGWGGRAEGRWIQTPKDVHHKGKGSRCPAGPGSTGLEEQHSRTAGEYAAGPHSQSAASAFLPSRGADPGKTLLWWERCTN